MRKTCVYAVGAGVPDGPLVGHACRDGGAIRESPLRGDGKLSPSPVASDILPRWGRNRRWERQAPASQRWCGDPYSLTQGRRMRGVEDAAPYGDGGRGLPHQCRRSLVRNDTVGTGETPLRHRRKRRRHLPFQGRQGRCVGAGITRPLVGHRRMSAERSGDRSLRGNVRPHRRGRRAGVPDGPLVGHACRDGGRGKPLPYGETSVRIVGAGVPDGPLVGRSRMSAERSGDRSLRVNPFRQRRALHAADTSALRCPKNAAHIRLLAFFDLRFICHWQREAAIPPEGEARPSAA